MTFLRRLLYLLRHRRMEAEFAEELETHRLLAQQRELQAGAADAAAASRRAMGNVTLAREDARAQWIAPWLDSVWQDGMYALRGFRRAPAFTGAFVLVMALGVGATTAVFALVDGLVLRDLPVSRPDRLVYFSSPSFSYPIFTGVQARSTDVLTSVAAWSIEDEYVAWSQQLEPSEVLTASGGFYDTLGVTAAVGRTFSDADDRIGGGSEGRVAVISYSAWQRRYGGDPGVVGRTVRVGPDTYTIVGVTPRAFFGVAPGVAPEITIPLTSNARPSSLQSATSSWVHLIGRLRDGVSLAEANTALQRFWPAVLEGARRNQGARGQAGVFPRTSDVDRIGAGRLLAGPQPLRQAACGSSSPSSRCCSWLRRRARPTCCSRAAQGGGARSPCASPSAPAGAGWCGRC